jgi:replication factor C subunit 1
MGIPIIREPVFSENVKEMFTTKYHPTCVAEIIGHKDVIAAIREWLTTFVTHGATKGLKKGLLITGPPGIGKTSLVHLIAAEMGYAVTEYNASDTRSVAMLRGLIGLGMNRLRKEVIVMDEVDGLSERGGVGEIAELIRRSTSPVICIANDRPPKLKPIISACVDIKCSRPMRGTIATALLSIAAKEGITITKVELEEMCEKNGNDIRAILNALQFYSGATNVPPHPSLSGALAPLNPKSDNLEKDASKIASKDAIHRLDLFSATQKLFSNKRCALSQSEDYVYVDYHMVPLMVQEAYAAAATSVDELEAASDLLSHGDLIDRAIWRTQDWSLLPVSVANTVSIAKSVKGNAPFNIFPQFLGKMSKRQKHARWMENICKPMRCNRNVMRLDYTETLRMSLLRPLLGGDIKAAIAGLDAIGLTRDDLETLCEVSFDPVEIPTKVKAGFTREWNKRHMGKKRKMEIVDDSEEMEEMEELEEEMEGLEI